MYLLLPRSERRTNTFIAYPEKVWMSCPVRIVEFGLRHQMSTSLIDRLDRFFVGNTELVRTISNNRAVFLVECREIVGLLQGHELVHLPEIGERGKEWPWISGQWM